MSPGPRRDLKTCFHVDDKQLSRHNSMLRKPRLEHSLLLKQRPASSARSAHLMNKMPYPVRDHA